MDDALAALSARVAALEDELAIHRLLVRYGFCADTGNAEAAAALFAEDAEIRVDGVVAGQGHDAATATGYSFLRWLIASRHTALLDGSDRPHEMLRRGLA